MTDPQVHEEHLRKARFMVTSYGQRGPYRTNPDPVALEGLIQALARQWDRLDHMFCPCRQLSGDFAEDRHKICPCIWHRAEIAADGHCRCGLFVSPDYDPAKDPLGRNVTPAGSATESPYAHDLVLYCTAWSRECRRAKALLNRYGVPFREVDIEQDPAAAHLVEEANSGARSVPTVFADGQHVATAPEDREFAALLGFYYAPPITLYTTPWCRDSRRTKTFLRRYGLPYDEVNIEADLEAARQVEQLNNGLQSTPTVFVDGRHVATEPSDRQLASLLGIPYFPEVLLYCKAGDEACEAIAAFLRAQHVPFSEVDVEASRPAADKVRQVAGECRVPMLEVGDQTLVCPDEAKLRQALAL